MIDPIPFFSGSYILPRTIIGAAFPISKKGLINLKKLTKQIISIALGAVTAASCGTMAFAADKTLNQDTPSGSSTVEYSEESTYTATIPAYIKVQKMSEDVDTNANSVTLRDVIIPDGKSLVGTVTYNGVVAEENNVKIPYKLATAEGDLTSGSTIITQTSGKSTEEKTSHFGAVATEKPKYSGYYTDTATFSFDEVGATNAFFEQIKANNYTLNIGKTKPEYVVAKFNKDFTKVTISKNGNDSDGLMRGAAFAYAKAKGDIQYPLASILKEVEILDGVKNIGFDSFKSYTSLSNVTVANSVTSIESSAFNGCTSLAKINIPSGVTTIEKWTFARCYALKSITLPDGLVNIESSAFSSCSSLANVVIPNSVTNIGSSAFFSCLGFTSIIIPNSVKDVGSGAFKECRNLKSVVLSNNMTRVNDGLFEGCSSLKSIAIPNSVTSIGKRAFRNCSLSSVNIGSGVVSLDGNTFEGCSLEAIYVNSENSDYTSVDGVLFSKDGTELVYYPSGRIGYRYAIPDGTKTIRSNAFMTMQLSDIIIPNSMTSIGDYAFYKCANLHDITIPDSVTNIATDAFKDCNLLNTVYGTTGSYAETWAKTKGCKFVAQ